MTKRLLVGAGGFLGSALRYLVGGLVYRARGGTLFPLDTPEKKGGPGAGGD